MPERSAEEIRAAIEENREQLGTSLVKLRDEVTELTDWRRVLRQNQGRLTAAAAATGFVVAGGIAGLAGMVGSRRRRR